VWFYLRGEEYSAQIDYFVKSIEQGRLDGQNTFRSALQADRIVSMILAQAQGAPAPASATARASEPAGARGILARLFG
jgi:hypothetical protein